MLIAINFTAQLSTDVICAKIIDRLEALGFIGPDDGKKQGRPVYLTASQLAEYRMNGLPGSDDDD